MCDAPIPSLPCHNRHLAVLTLSLVAKDWQDNVSYSTDVDPTIRIWQTTVQSERLCTQGETSHG